MKYWTAEEIADGATFPDEMVSILSGVLYAIEEHGEPTAKLIRLGRTDAHDDYNRFEVDIELAPGVVLPTAYGTLEGLSQGWEDEADDLDGVVGDFVEGLTACHELLEQLADTLHDLRRRARSAIAAWQRAGLPAKLVDVRLAPYDAWRRSTVPVTQVLFESLDERLERFVEEVRVETPAEMEKALADRRLALEQRNTARIGFGEQGASGTIDQLALNAIAHFDDLAANVRQFASEWRFWLPDESVLILSDGHATLGTGANDARITWWRDTVIVTSLTASQEQLEAAVGQPVSTLLDHDYLTPDIVVTEARWVVEDDREFVLIAFDQPRRLFCSTTGRVWDNVTTEPASTTVIPFRAREG